MLRKIKPQNPLSFRANANSGAKGKKKKRDTKRKKSGAKYPHTFFVFRTSRPFLGILR